MDYDIYNRSMLQAGAYHQGQTTRQSDWHPFASAPRDGTIIEVRCTYGVAPWFGLYRWITPGTKVSPLNDGQPYEERGRWAKVGDDNAGFSEDASFSWRAYHGKASDYVDPTGGAQNSAAYWRGAVAAKYGLPLDTFEKTAERNVRGDPKTAPSPSWWRRLFGR